MSITQNIILLNKHIMEQTYYEILEVKTTATQDEIKTSWKRLSREYHPDKAKQENLATCETKIKLIYGVNDVELELTFDPPYHQDMMSEAAKLELGFL